MFEIKDLSGAVFSDCRQYRYVLWRIWDATLPKVMFIGLNPSKANEHTNDATIRRVIGFAKKHGYGGFYMMNLFAIVSTDPNYLVTCKDPLGENDKYLEIVSAYVGAVVFCWGAFKQVGERAEIVKSKFPEGYCLGKTKDGHPKHPVRLSGQTKFEKYHL